MNDEVPRNAQTPEEKLDFEPAPGPTDADLSKVVQLARDQVRLEDEVARIEAALSAKKEELRTLSQSTLPLALTELGLSGLPLLNGYAIKLKDVAGGSISKERHPAACAWLEESGNGAIIKHTVTVQFGKGEEAWYNRFIRDLERRKKPLAYERKDTVHPQTLGKLVREILQGAKEAGLDPKAALPWETLGVYDFRVTEVVRPEAKQ